MYIRHKLFMNSVHTMDATRRKDAEVQGLAIVMLHLRIIRAFFLAQVGTVHHGFDEAQ